jgi:hypothetical protein
MILPLDANSCRTPSPFHHSIDAPCPSKSTVMKFRYKNRGVDTGEPEGVENGWPSN